MKERVYTRKHKDEADMMYLFFEDEATKQIEQSHVNFIKSFIRSNQHTIIMHNPKKESYSRNVHRRKVHDWYIGKYGHCIYCDLGLRIIENDEIVLA
jgi:hypothetical protein